jgi:L-2-hydroxyglutarate oxidase LhgO
MDKVDFLIIGAGIIGLAVAKSISEKYSDSVICLFEKNESFGRETSSRNSEVIHSGIYYPENTLKANLCVEGKNLLYNYCNEKKIRYKRCGKIIVANTEQDFKEIENLYIQGKANGLSDLCKLSSKEINNMEPEIAAIGGLYSPGTGIVDSHSVMQSLENDAISNDVLIGYRHEVQNINKSNDSYLVEYTNPEKKIELIKTSYLINCAGLYSDKISEMLGIDTEKYNLKNYYLKGEYFSVDEKYSGYIKRLIYPRPSGELKGLGIHATISLDGSIRLGPNTIPVKSIDYTLDESHRDEFFKAGSIYLPFLDKDDLRPDMCGIRPKLSKDYSFCDFYIKNEKEKNLENYINLAGIESPGLTSCIAIGNYTASLA